MPAEDTDEIAPGNVAVGRVVSAWGVRGEIKVEPLAPAALLSRGRSVSLRGRSFQIERSRRRGRFVHLELAGIESREDAQTLSGAYLQTAEAALEPLGEDEYYRFQLIGLSVRTTDGRDLGRVAEVFSTAGNDVYVVRGPLGEILVPAVDDIVVNVDTATRVITIEVVPGLLP